MPKTPKNKPANTSPKLKPLYSTQPWKCVHHRDHCDITAYVEASGQWEIVATIPTTAGFQAEAIANFICGLVNKHQQNQNLLQDAMAALEAVMDDGLNFSTEQAAEKVLTQIKKSEA